MLQILDTYASLFKSWQVIRYEQEGEAYLLQLSALLQDDSRLELRDHLFADGSRKYAYQWMEADGTLRRRWDNAPHWPGVGYCPSPRTPARSGDTGAIHCHKSGGLVALHSKLVRTLKTR